MAGLKEIKKRINSVKNIRKITKTMEMVSAAKSRKMMLRVHESQPYGKKIFEIMENLSQMVGNVDSPFLQPKEDPKTYLLFIITANRGLCGAYNSNVLRLARQRIRELQEKEKNLRIYVMGKKGATYFKFVRIPVDKVYPNYEDKIRFEDAKNIMNELMMSFLQGEFDVLEVISTHYYSSTSQKPDVKQLLPMITAEKKERVEPNTLFLPSKEQILKKIIPYMLEYSLYKLMLEATTSEQIYRRIAMKSASDAAGDMTKILTRMYNRKRQGKITQEIAEIVTSADAIQ
ncbi:MAG: ATP synthase F1 subunit gamma [Leptospiraceae bacterium]|nr:ATP synthase F1 subunit gamma [Leptospiraceae bacterium]MDW7977040.1 ATP synthase F1 subunit gamma [Leptospiraceae bacterium]